LSIHYQEYGDRNAPLLIFLHGGGVSGWMWDKQIQYFTGYHCIVPDLPGHGLNHQASDFTIRDSAEEILRLIEEKVNGKPVTLIGFSLGSQIIIQLLSMKPDLIDCAIINSALVRPLSYAKRWIAPSVRLSAPFIRYRWFSKLQAKELYVGEGDFEQYYEESCRMKPDILIQVLEENMAFGIPEDFRRASGKILVTVGEKEKGIMKKSAEDLVNANSNCVGIVIPGVGHGAPLAMPEYFNHLVEAWVQDGKLPKEYRGLS
jgi:pimeloyl-ACP methyl ester carboxylesterase